MLKVDTYQIQCYLLTEASMVLGVLGHPTPPVDAYPALCFWQGSVAVVHNKP